MYCLRKQVPRQCGFIINDGTPCVWHILRSQRSQPLLITLRSAAQCNMLEAIDREIPPQISMVLENAKLLTNFHNIGVWIRMAPGEHRGSRTCCSVDPGCAGVAVSVYVGWRSRSVVAVVVFIYAGHVDICVPLVAQLDLCVEGSDLFWQSGFVHVAWFWIFCSQRSQQVHDLWMAGKDDVYKSTLSGNQGISPSAMGEILYWNTDRSTTIFIPSCSNGKLWLS